MAALLGDFEQRILFALIRLGADAYGVTIREEIEARTGRAVSAGALYTALDRLEKRGLVASRLGEPTPNAAASANASTPCSPQASARSPAPTNRCA